MSGWREYIDQRTKAGQKTKIGDFLSQFAAEFAEMDKQEKREWSVQTCGQFIKMRRNLATGKFDFFPIYCKNHRECFHCLNARRCAIQTELKAARSEDDLMAVEFRPDDKKDEQKFTRKLRKLERAYRRIPYLADNDGEIVERILIVYPGDGSEHGESYGFNRIIDSDANMMRLVNTPEGRAITGSLGKADKQPLKNESNDDIEIVDDQLYYTDNDGEAIDEVNEELLEEVSCLSFNCVQDALDYLNARFEQECYERGLSLYRDRIEKRKVNRNQIEWCRIESKRPLFDLSENVTRSFFDDPRLKSLLELEF